MKNRIATTTLIFSFIIFGLIPCRLFPDNSQNLKINKSPETVSFSIEMFHGIEMVMITMDSLQFWISRYEVTQELYKSVMAKNPSYFRGDKLPVEQISWFNAIEFCNRLSIKGGFTPYYIISKQNNVSTDKMGWTIKTDNQANGFRLPTSQEWEFAAFAGSENKHDNIDDFCWYRKNSGGSTHPVGTKKPNAFKIFDICGNVREWCFDWHPLFKGQYRVLRDGHYDMSAEELHPSLIDHRDPRFEFGFTGIRLVKNR